MFEAAVGCNRRNGTSVGCKREWLRRSARLVDRCERGIANHESAEQDLGEPAHRRVVDRMLERGARIRDLAGRGFDRVRSRHVFVGNVVTEVFRLDRRSFDRHVGLGEQLDRFAAGGDANSGSAAPQRGVRSGLRRPTRERLRTDAAFGQEKAQPFRIAGNKTQRLNCNDFSHFARVVNRLFQQMGLPFR